MYVYVYIYLYTYIYKASTLCLPIFEPGVNTRGLDPFLCGSENSQVKDVLFKTDTTQERSKKSRERVITRANPIYIYIEKEGERETDRQIDR